jgi:hypothetical protein
MWLRYLSMFFFKKNQNGILEANYFAFNTYGELHTRTAELVIERGKVIKGVLDVPPSKLHPKWM